MKYLLVLIVVMVAVWLWLRGRSDNVSKRSRRPGRRAASAAPMVVCVHCGVHLPAGEAVSDAAGRPFCSEDHRLAGPR